MALWRDLRNAARMLLRCPGFTLGAVLTISLGMAGTVSALAVCRAAFFAPLSIPEPDRIGRLFLFDPQVNDRKFSLPDYEQVQGETHIFAAVAAYTAADVELRSALSDGMALARGDTQRVVTHRVSPNYFSALGVPMRLGHGFDVEQDREDAEAVAVLSSSLWQRQYGGNPDVLGRRILLNGKDVIVIGVAPPEFHGIDPVGPDLWIPYKFAVEGAAPPETRAQARWLYLIAQLKPGVTMSQAQAALAVADQRRSERPQRENTRILLTAASVINTESRGRVVPLVAIVLGAVGFVLLIACANVANLLLARGVARRRELMTRLALGASRFQVIRQLLAESVLLSLLGALGGTLLAEWTIPVLYLAVVSTAGGTPADLPFHIDRWVLAATAMVSASTAVLFGLAPALHATRVNLVSALRDGSAVRLTASRLRNVFVAVQFALSLVLLAGAGLFTRALVRSQFLDLGFDASNILVVSADLPRYGYDQAHMQAFYKVGEARFPSLPGVHSVSLVRVVPASDLYLGDTVSIERTTLRNPDGNRLVTYYDVVSPNYFATMQIPIARGRPFSLQEPGANTVVVNEAFVRRFLHGTEPIGSRIRLGGVSSSWVEVIGVAKDTTHGRPGAAPEPLVYRPLTDPYPPDLSFLVRTSGDPAAVASALAGETRAIDPRLSFSVKTMRDSLRSTMWPAKVGALLAALLASLAVALAAVGLFGVMAYTINQRLREVAIRMAVGASSSDVLALLLQQTAGMVGAGTLIGLAVATAISRALSMFLFGLSPWDPLAFAGSVILLGAIAFLATYLPARRGMQVNLTSALRQE